MNYLVHGERYECQKESTMKLFRMKWIASGLLGGAILLASCRTSNPQDDRTSASQPVAADQAPLVTRTRSHSVQDARLRALMGSIGRKANSLPAGMPAE